MITKLDTDEKVNIYNRDYQRGELSGVYLYRIYMNKCGYCENMMDEWNKFLKESNVISKINIVEIESRFLDKINNPQIKNIPGYPTILILKDNNNRTEFNRERKASNFTHFVVSFINNQRGGRLVNKTKKRKSKSMNKKLRERKRRKSNKK